MVKTKKFILEKHFVGQPKESDLRLVEDNLPALKDRCNFSFECGLMLLHYWKVTSIVEFSFNFLDLRSPALILQYLWSNAVI
jgi:hypothetical protein